jgi:hypothetical protein
MTAILSYAITRTLDDGTQLYGAPNGANGLPLSGEKGQALGPGNTVSLILGLEKMAEMADYLNEHFAAEKYRAQAQLSRQAIDKLLWNATGGYYSGSLGTSGFDTMDIAQVLLAEIGTAARRKEFLGNLNALKLPAGYSNGTRFAGTPAVVNPYYMSFLLEGLAMANETTLAQSLLDDTWSPMVRRDVNYTGALWEYVVSLLHSFTIILTWSIWCIYLQLDITESRRFISWIGPIHRTESLLGRIFHCLLDRICSGCPTQRCRVHPVRICTIAKFPG